MISSVFVSGRLGDALGEKTRYVEVDRVVPGPSGLYETDKFPVRTMLCKDGLFMTAKKGAYITLKGRIENDPELGLVIVDEIDEIMVVPSTVKPM